MIAVIGCGNSNRSDDGVGPAVIRELVRRGLAQDGAVKLFDAGTDGMAVMFAARGCRTLIVVDASRSGAQPGYMLQIHGPRLEQDDAHASFTTHDFRWNHALYAGRRIYGDEFPRDTIVLLIEAESTALGIDLSAPVAGAVQRAADDIHALVRERMAAAS